MEIVNVGALKRRVNKPCIGWPHLSHEQKFPRLTQPWAWVEMILHFWHAGKIKNQEIFFLKKLLPVLTLQIEYSTRISDLKADFVNFIHAIIEIQHLSSRSTLIHSRLIFWHFWGVITSHWPPCVRAGSGYRNECRTQNFLHVIRLTAMKSVMLTPLFSHHCLSWIMIGGASGIDSGFGSPRMYPVPSKLFPYCFPPILELERASVSEQIYWVKWKK